MSTNHKRKKLKIRLYKIRNFGSSKNIIKEVKRQVTDGEKIITIHISIKDSYSKYIKNLYRSVTETKKFKMNKTLGQSLLNKIYLNSQ